MNINQPLAKWTRTEHYTNIAKFTNGREFVSIPCELVEQLQSEAEEKGYKKGVFEQFTTVSKATQKEIEEARADERKKRESKDRNVYARAYDLAKKSYGDAYNFLMDYIDTDKQKELEQPVEENKNNTGIFFSSPVEEPKILSKKLQCGHDELEAHWSGLLRCRVCKQEYNSEEDKKYILSIMKDKNVKVEERK